MAQDGRTTIMNCMKPRYLDKLDSIGQNVSDPYSFESGTDTTDTPE